MGYSRARLAWVRDSPGNYVNIKKPIYLQFDMSSTKNPIYTTYYNTKFKLNNKLYLYLSKYFLKYNYIKELKVFKNNTLVITFYIISIVILLEVYVIKL